MNKVKTVSNTAILLGILTLLLHFAVQAESTVEQDIGELEYTSFCATCHGSDGKGNGPKANQLSATPTNLTLLSKVNGGSFPETAVYNIIDGRRVGDFHGQEMPIWGEHFMEIEGNEEVVDERISNLIEYLKSIQVE
ncbi:MAG: cytochrome c [Gammaproteobacteria bacterium]|nr:cytochrome c [Gammaproteobacteria bacterium]